MQLEFLSERCIFERESKEARGEVSGLALLPDGLERVRAAAGEVSRARWLLSKDTIE